MDIKLIFIREESGEGVFFELKINFQAEQLLLLNNFSVGWRCIRKYVFRNFGVNLAADLSDKPSKNLLVK